MKTTVKYIPAPMIVEFQLFTDEQDFYNEIIEQGYVNVDVKYNTKTSLRISVSIGKHNFHVNQARVEGLLYHTGKNPSVFDAKRHASYLKVNNGLAGVIKHVEAVFKDLPMETLELRIYETRPVMELRKKEDATLFNSGMGCN